MLLSMYLAYIATGAPIDTSTLSTTITSTMTSTSTTSTSTGEGEDNTLLILMISIVGLISLFYVYCGCMDSCSCRNSNKKDLGANISIANETPEPICEYEAENDPSTAGVRQAEREDEERVNRAVQDREIATFNESQRQRAELSAQGIYLYTLPQNEEFMPVAEVEESLYVAFASDTEIPQDQIPIKSQPTPPVYTELPQYMELQPYSSASRITEEPPQYIELTVIIAETTCSGNTFSDC